MQGSKLYVGNLSYSTTEEQLKELFAPHGEVKSVKIIGDKGFGFVEMGNQAEAEKAQTELNGKEFGGRQIKVDEAKPPREKDDRGPRRFNSDRRF